MVFIEANHHEWCQMWEDLSNETINKGDPICLFMGACWEYMGSTDDHHHFRHLKHPATGNKEFMYIERHNVTLNWARAC